MEDDGIRVLGQNPEKFWMVIRGRGEGAFTTKARHMSFSSAHAEAERLSRKEGEAFYVLEATYVLEPAAPPVSSRRL